MELLKCENCGRIFPLEDASRKRINYTAYYGADGPASYKTHYACPHCDCWEEVRDYTSEAERDALDMIRFLQESPHKTPREIASEYYTSEEEITNFVEAFNYLGDDYDI